MTLEYIVGLPSGQIINLTNNDLKKLLNLGYVEWDILVVEFIFKDGYRNQIINFIKNIKQHDIVSILNTDKKGLVTDIIVYDNKKIDGIDYSKIFKKGDYLYKVRFRNEYENGIYLKHQLIKDEISNEIFIK